jgi:chaperonin GroEL
MKRIEFNKESRKGLMSGVNILAEAVGSTLGAKGRNVIFNIGKNHVVTKDGVTVAGQIQSDDAVEQAGIDIVREAARRTAKEAGDGTTTSTVISRYIIQEAMKAVDGGANPMDLKRGMDIAVKDITEEVESIKRVITSKSETKQIATVSANNDPVIGDMISELFDKVGRSGAIRIEETQANETKIDMVEGCQINAPMLSPGFVTNTNRRTAEYSDAMVFITDKVFDGAFSELIPVLQAVVEASDKAKKRIPLIIICGGMEGETLGSLLMNKNKEGFPVVAVQAPEFGTGREEILQDLAIITGATVIQETGAINLSEVEPSHLGFADKIIVDQFTTTIIGRHGSPEEISERAKAIEIQKEEDRGNNQEFRFKKRIASLVAGIGVIYVGGNSETEMKENFFRIEDAVHATKSSLDDGFVPGGGVAYIRCARERKEHVNEDHRDGYNIVMDSMEEPLRVMSRNCGIDEEHIIQSVKRSTFVTKDISFGYNALTDNFESLYESGVIDPAAVVKSAVKNSVSVAGMIITTNCVILDQKETK